jgi:hypothetical protein
VILPEVRIKRKHRPHMKRSRNKAVLRMDVLDFLNDRWDRTDVGDVGTDMEMDNEEFDIGHYVANVLDHTRQRYSNILERPYLCVDWSHNDIKRDLGRNSFVSNLDSIIVITDDPRRPVNYDLKHLDRQTEIHLNGGVPPHGISGFVNITTLPNERRRLIHGREYNIQGFSRPAEFNNPDYSRQALPDVKDYRKTLYWNPDVTTDSEGRASIDFYNNSVAPVFNISVEGITKDGRFVVY